METNQVKKVFLGKDWKAEYEAVVGLKHRKPVVPNPGQDAALAIVNPKPMIITADGAGSSIVSDIGAQRVVAGIYRLIDTIYNSQFAALDKEEALKEGDVRKWALILTKHAKGILSDLAQEYRRETKDFNCTLIAAIVGDYHTFWFKVGDGALAVEKAVSTSEGIQHVRHTLGNIGKGEYANHTVFISDKLDVNQVEHGVLPSDDVSAVFAMSDGAAFKFVSNDGQQVAAKLSGFAQMLREGKLNRMALTKFFYTEQFLENHDGDDCSLALIAR